MGTATSDSVGVPIPACVRNECNRVSEQLSDQLQPIFESCYLNTLKYAISRYGSDNWDGTYFVRTGDIDDMWIRDSSAQINQYLPLVGQDDAGDLRAIIEGVIQRQIAFIKLSPTANSFTPTGQINSGDYELDSNCYFIRLIYTYLTTAGDAASDSLVADIKSVVEIVLTLWHENQQQPGVAGMTSCTHRPSDDECQYPYLVPSNMFAAAMLEHVTELANGPWGDPALAERAQTLREQIMAAIQSQAILAHDTFGQIYAYEVDGKGGANFMDDANIPNLLSIPYIGYAADSSIYKSTVRFILTDGYPPSRPGDPWYVNQPEYKYQGLGSYHTLCYGPYKPYPKAKGGIWYLSLTLQALLAQSKDDFQPFLNDLVANSFVLQQEYGYMHESFYPDGAVSTDENSYTRKWFGWANSFFAEMIIKQLSYV